jgi:hypothetical protein
LWELNSLQDAEEEINWEVWPTVWCCHSNWILQVMCLRSNFILTRQTNDPIYTYLWLYQDYLRI